MKTKILYEDSNVLAIDKPSGISVHGDGRTKEKTVADWILKNYPRMKNVGENEVYENKKIKTEIKKPGIVHRLDRETSGVLLLAKNKKAYEFLKSQFQNREIKKTYIAIVSGNVKTERGIINKPIGRSPKDFRRYLSGRGARGEMRDAVTEYRVLKRFEAPYVQNFSRSSLPRVRGGIHADKNFKHTVPFSYLEIRPKTGRTHQIRVHMKFLNHPIAGDALYNPGAKTPKGLKRMALHAKSIEFKNLKGEVVKVESKLPKEFGKVVV
ncbi:MAG TPA: RluA family pseudouridine synthase [Candidatus Paceibacterota bacterium]